MFHVTCSSWRELIILKKTILFIISIINVNFVLTKKVFMSGRDHSNNTLSAAKGLQLLIHFPHFPGNGNKRENLLRASKWVTEQEKKNWKNTDCYFLMLYYNFILGVLSQLDWLGFIGYRVRTGNSKCNLTLACKIALKKNVFFKIAYLWKLKI